MDRPPAPSEYQCRLDQSRSDSTDLKQRSFRLSLFRLAAMLTTIVAGFLGFDLEAFHPAWAVVPLAAFAALVVAHRRVAQAEEAARRRIGFYETGIRRLEGRWPGHGKQGASYCDREHPYADDLDLFGPGSLFELLCTARTGSGERCLARWLLEPAAPTLIPERQSAIRELRMRLDLRERLALIGADVSGAVHPEIIETWAAAPAVPISPLARFASFALPAATLASLAGWASGEWGVLPFLVLVCAQVFFANRMQSWTRTVTAGMRQPARELALFSELLDLVETEVVHAPCLARIRQQLHAGNRRASRQIARLRNIEVLIDSANNMLFGAVAGLLQWHVHLAVALERWRSQNSPFLPGWFEAVGAFEALNALAGYSYEHPRDPFPEFIDRGPAFEGRDLRHPLLPEELAVANDVHLGGDNRVLVVSGSNMSGKSTLLRTVGCNIVLALAGAPVRAESLRLSRLAIGASIVSRDSLLEGRSRFYAEITRMKEITDLCSGDAPVLFLLDEILHGTNSHDRRIGAELLVRHLLDQGAVGLVTTHDLALARLADALQPEVANVHFEDQMTDGELVFDYRLRPGTVTTSNALELMRIVGLPIAAPPRDEG